MKYKVKDNFILENEVLYKGKTPWILMIVIFAISMISTYITYKGGGVGNSKAFIAFTSTNYKGFWDIFNNAICNDFLLPFVIILAANIVGKDYSSGFVKNIFVSDNRINNLIAKYLVLLESILLMFIFTFLSVVVNITIFVKPHGAGDFQACMKFLLAELLALFAVGTVIFFIAYLTKKTSISLAIGLIYYIVISGQIFNLINKLVYNVFKVKHFNINKYMLASQFNYLLNHISNRVFNRSVVVSVIFIVIFMALTTFVLKKQDV